MFGTPPIMSLLSVLYDDYHILGGVKHIFLYKYIYYYYKLTLIPTVFVLIY